MEIPSTTQDEKHPGITKAPGLGPPTVRERVGAAAMAGPNAELVVVHFGLFLGDHRETLSLGKSWVATKMDEQMEQMINACLIQFESKRSKEQVYCILTHVHNMHTSLEVTPIKQISSKIASHSQVTNNFQ